MLNSRFSVRSAAPQVIVPQPVLSLVCVGAVVSPATWPESACRAGVVLFLLLPLICLRNLLLRLTTLWLTRLLRLQILSPFVLLLVLILQHLFLLVTAPVTVPTAPASVAAPVTVSAAPACLLPQPLFLLLYPPQLPLPFKCLHVPSIKTDFVPLPQYSSDPEIVEKKLRGYVKKINQM